jgi:hypothetical protein
MNQTLSNPFATRHTRPGALEFLLPQAVTLAELVERLKASGWRGEIVGPHGTGKSTLLAALVPALRAAGREVREVTLFAGQSQLPVTAEETAGWTRATQLVIDGYEQLGWPSRLWLQATLALTGAGLLLTTHEPQGYPVLFTTHVDADLAWSVVSRLLPEPPPCISRASVAALLETHAGNMREVLFSLYDLYPSQSEHRDAE